MRNMIVGKESFICEDTNCYTLEYHILVTGCKGDLVNPVYGFEVKKKMQDIELESVKIEEYTGDEDEIKRLVSLLKNNIVTPVSVFEVIQDLRSA
mgnify:FL=1